MGGDQTSSSVTPAAGGIRIQTSVYGSCIPVVYGKTRVPSNLIWYGDFTSIAHTSQQSSGGTGGKGGGSSTTSTTTYSYTAGVIMALGEGMLTVGRVWRGKDLLASLSAAGLGQSSGAVGQAVWGWLQSTNPSQALAYSGFAYAYAPAYDLGDTPSVDNHSFELTSTITSVASGDASPAACVVDMLTNAQYGADFPSSMLGSTTAWDTYAKAQNLLVSMVLDSQKPASDWLRDALSISHTDCVWSQGVLKFVPLGDAAVTANGITYTPNNTPLYDLTDDVYVTTGTEDPLVIERKSADDTFNCIKVEYTDRADQYNLQVVESRDAADIDARGLRIKSTVQAHGLHEAARANILATLLLQQELGVRNTYKFKLPWTFALLDPLDLVTVTDPYLGLVRIPVRINSITELDSGDFEVEAEDCPIGMTTAPTYGSQAGSGFAHDYNAAPGNVTTPTFFEPPIDLTTTGLEVWAAVSGSGALWGGCNVWASLDGLTYKKVGKVDGGSRYGVTTTTLAAGGTSVGVALTGKGGTMLSASSVDAAQNASLCFVGTSAGGEFFNHVGAALTGTNAYTLSGLVRGAYGSINSAHASGQQFVRVDQAVAKSEPLDVSMVGQTLHFKFTSFNVYGGGEQDLASVTDYTYNITGSMLKLPPSDVPWLLIDGDRLSWGAVAELDVVGYEIRFNYGNNNWWPTAQMLHAGVITETPYTLVQRPVGAITFLIKAVDSLGNYSANAAVVATNIEQSAATNLVLNAPEAPTFTGTITNGAVSLGVLQANSVDMFFMPSDEPMFLPDTDPFYYASSYADMIYEWYVQAPASGRLFLDTTISAVAYAIEYARAAQDAMFTPAADPMFTPSGDLFFGAPGDWLPWPGDLVLDANERVGFRILTTGGATCGQIIAATAYADAPNITESFSNLVVSAGGTRLPITRSYTRIVNVQVTVQVDGNSGVTARVDDKSATLGPLIHVLNAAGTAVAGLVDVAIAGYL